MSTDSSPTVLVVEDEPSFVEALSIGLRREGFIVAVATDGFEALDRFDMALDPEEHTVVLRGEALTLPLKEFELLHVLLANAGRVLPRDTLIDRVWGSDYVGDTKTLDVHVKRLRSKIEHDPANPTRIVTIRGLGYKFERVP
jgi:two-component system response regulator RegX3